MTFPHKSVGQTRRYTEEYCLIFDSLKKSHCIQFILSLVLLVSWYSAKGQDTSMQFTIPLTGDEVIETTAVFGSSVLISQVKEAVRSKYIPTRQYTVLDSSFKIKFDTTPVIPFRHKPKGGFLGR